MVFCNDNIEFDDIYVAKFFSDSMGLNIKKVYKINLDEGNFCKNDPESIVLARRLGWHKRFKECKACKDKINREIIPLS